MWPCQSSAGGPRTLEVPRDCFSPPFRMEARRLGAHSQGSVTGTHMAMGLCVCLTYLNRETRLLRPRQAVCTPSCPAPAPAFLYPSTPLSSYLHSNFLNVLSLSGSSSSASLFSAALPDHPRHSDPSALGIPIQ